MFLPTIHSEIEDRSDKLSVKKRGPYSITSTVTASPVVTPTFQRNS